MFFHDRELQREVHVDNPDPGFAKALQQAIGGIEGEIRVATQYMFQSFSARGPTKYRDLLMETATEELGGHEGAHPIPNSFSQEDEDQEHNYNFMSTWRDDGESPPEGRWMEGPSIDGKGEFTTVQQPGGQEPKLGLGTARLRCPDRADEQWHHLTRRR